MKTRVISGIVTAIIGACAVIFLFTPFVVVFTTVLCVVSTYEIMKCAGVKSKIIQIPAMIFSALFPTYFAYGDKFLSGNFPVASILAVFTVLMMILMIFKYKSIKFEQLTITLYASIFIPYAFSCIIILRDTYITYPVYTQAESAYILLLGVFCCIFADTFAYFVGVKFGKHKLCPGISPKKSVEGAIGGLVCSVVLNALIFIGAKTWVFGGETKISLVFVIVTSLVLSIISMFGDLSASVLKRNFGVKDFGKIIPGHGGIMDRFDSYVFVLPLLVTIVKFMNM